MSKWDPTIIVAIVSTAGIVISAGFGVLIAVITHRRETSGSATMAAEKAAERAVQEKEEALRERLQLRDEQLDNHRQEIARLKMRIVDLEADNERLRRRQRDLS